MPSTLENGLNLFDSECAMQEHKVDVRGCVPACDVCRSYFV
jgi:hypothetical protein